MSVILLPRSSVVMLESICSAACASSVPAFFNSTLTVCLASSERLSICLHQSAKRLKLICSFGGFSDIKHSEMGNGAWAKQGMDNRNTVDCSLLTVDYYKSPLRTFCY